MSETYAAVLDLRLYSPEQRLALVEMTLAHLATGEAIQIITHTEPDRLRQYVMTHYGDQVDWRTDDRGPEIWTAVVTRNLQRDRET